MPGIAAGSQKISVNKAHSLFLQSFRTTDRQVIAVYRGKQECGGTIEEHAFSEEECAEGADISAGWRGTLLRCVLREW